MQIYRYNFNSIVICNDGNISNSLINFLNYFQKNKENSNLLIYLYGNESLENISEKYLNTFYIKELSDIKFYNSYSQVLLELDKKINRLLLLQDYELLNVEKYVLYEVCMALETLHKNKLDVNKIKLKIIKYLENKNKFEMASQIQKIKIYG